MWNRRTCFGIEGIGTIQGKYIIAVINCAQLKHVYASMVSINAFYPLRFFSHTPDQDFRCFYPCEIIKIYHECEGRIKNLSGGSPFGITRLA